jgi:hypothetical protein
MKAMIMSRQAAISHSLDHFVGAANDCVWNLLTRADEVIE